MMDWDKLRVFHAVAQAGSFTISQNGKAVGTASFNFAATPAKVSRSLRVSYSGRMSGCCRASRSAEGSKSFQLSSQWFTCPSWDTIHPRRDSHAAARR